MWKFLRGDQKAHSDPRQTLDFAKIQARNVLHQRPPSLGDELASFRLKEDQFSRLGFSQQFDHILRRVKDHTTLYIRFSIETDHHKKTLLKTQIEEDADACGKEIGPHDR